MKDESKRENRVFSVELNSKRSLRNVSLADGSDDNVLLEGTIGELLRATFADGIVLEVVGNEGVLRIDLREDEIKKQVTNQREVKNQ